MKMTDLLRNELEEQYFDHYDGLSKINLQVAIDGTKKNIKHLDTSSSPGASVLLKQWKQKLEFLEKIYNTNYGE